MMNDAHIASFLTGFFLEPDAVSERRQLVKLIVFFLVHYILNSDNSPFSIKNYVALLICRVGYIEDLNNLVSQYEWFVLVSDTFEVHSSDAVLADHDGWYLSLVELRMSWMRKSTINLTSCLLSETTSGSRKNYVAVLICWVRYIKNLNNLLS